MKTMLLPIYAAILIFVFAPVTSFAQCNVSSTPFFENFNTPTGSLSGCSKAGNNNGNQTSTLNAGQTKGAYTACSGSVAIMDNTLTCKSAAADAWKDQTNTGADGGGNGDYALFVDPCGGVPDGSVWCTSLSVTANQYYNFSAMISSPWNEEKQNDPDVYFSIGTTSNPTNGTDMVGSSTCIEQYTSSGPTPYSQMCRTYKIPTTGTYNFCINVKQRTSGTATTPCSGTYGANGQGNDVLIDDIKIQLMSGGGCTSGSACTSTTPVELIIFEAKKLSGSSSYLHWATASEKNSLYFSIEKNEDGTNFYEIGIINAQGTSNNVVNYEFGDYHFNKSSYYRLKMVDKDGSFKYSTVQFLENGDNYARVIKTETGDIEIKAMVNEATRWNVAVYTLMGQEYFNQSQSLTKGENTLLKGFNIGGNSAKILRITGEDGSVILSQVVIW